MKKITFRIIALLVCASSLFVGINIGKNSVAFAAERDTTSTVQVAPEVPAAEEVVEPTTEPAVVEDVPEETAPVTEPEVEETVVEETEAPEEVEIEETEPAETEPVVEEEPAPVHQHDSGCDHLWVYEDDGDGALYKSCLKCGAIS